MRDVILQTWQAAPCRNDQAIILPDECCDVIISHKQDEPAKVILTDLRERPHLAHLKKDTQMIGFRLQPGTRIDVNQLESMLRSDGPEHSQADSIRTVAQLDENLIDAVQCLASEQGSLVSAARAVGCKAKNAAKVICQTCPACPNLLVPIGPRLKMRACRVAWRIFA